MRVFYALILSLLISLESMAQITCPTFSGRNNGAGGTAAPTDAALIPVGKRASGRFTFSSGTQSFTVAKILLNGNLYQQGGTLYIGTIWFGGFNASSGDMFFYGNANNDNATPAGNWAFYFVDATNPANTGTCTYVIAANGSSSSFSPGVISSNQTICSGTTAAGLTGTAATGASGALSYKWQQSTTSSTNGFTDISLATAATYNPGSLTQTTYFQRIATDAAGPISVNSNVVTVTVNTVPAQPGAITGNATVSSAASQTYSVAPVSGATSYTWTLPLNWTGTSVTNSINVTTSTSSGTISVKANATGCASSAATTLSVTTLPVSWLNFSATKQDKKTLLNWSTANEQNTKDFAVLHSADGNNWKEIGSVTAAGNSSLVKDYSFIHLSPVNNVNFYRIQQRDLDGRSSYSAVAEVSFKLLADGIAVYPNPVTNGLLKVELAQSTTIKIYDNRGGLVLKTQYEAGIHTLNLSNLGKGNYLLQAGSISKKILIL